MQTQTNNSDFTDLMQIQRPEQAPGGAATPVIKAGQTRFSGTHTVGALGGDPHEPTVLIHRRGDAVDRIEFQCTCGRSAEVEIVYAEEEPPCG